MNRVQVKSRDGFWCTIEGDAEWCRVTYQPRIEQRHDRIVELGLWGVRSTMPRDQAPPGVSTPDPVDVDAHYLLTAATISVARLPLGMVLDRLAAGSLYLEGHEYDLLDGVQSVARLVFELDPAGFRLDTGEDVLDPGSVIGRVWPAGSQFGPPPDLAG